MLRAQPLAPLNLSHRHDDANANAMHGRKRALPPVGSMSQPSLQRSPRLSLSFPASVPVRDADATRREVMRPLRVATTDGLPGGRHNWSPPVLRPPRPSTEPGRARAARPPTESSGSPPTTAAPDGGVAADRGAAVKQEVAKQDVKLLYDSILNCYYDPQSNKYFELR